MAAPGRFRRATYELERYCNRPNVAAKPILPVSDAGVALAEPERIQDPGETCFNKAVHRRSQSCHDAAHTSPTYFSRAAVSSSSTFLICDSMARLSPHCK